MLSLAESLRKRIKGDVRFDPFSRRAYAVDASLYRVEPLGVVIPKTREDVFETMHVAKEQGAQIVPRGAATGIAGGCLGPGIVVDTSKHMNRILDINFEEEFAVCEPGVIQDQLNRALAPQGYCLGPDTSTGDRATLGGMVGHNATGAHSMRYGKMVDNVLSLETVLAQGEILEFGEVTAEEWERKTRQADAEGGIYREVDKAVKENAEEIEKRFPKIQRRVAGFNLDEFVKPGAKNLAKLITGSEGTLGMVTEIKVKIARKPKCTGLVAVLCDDLIEGLQGVPAMLEEKPFALELMDSHIVNMARQSPDMKGKMSWLQGNPGVILTAELDGETEGEVVSKMQAFEARVRRDGLGYSTLRILDPKEQKKIWAVRKAGLGLLLARRTRERAVAFIEDPAVGPDKLADFMREFRDLIRDRGKDAAFYGHAGVGCLHVRPMVDLGSAFDRDLMVRMMEDVADILKRYGGAVTGEHGDGLTRSWLNEKMFGPKLYQAFKDIKRAFDPEGRMNPGKVIANQGLLENLRNRDGEPTFGGKTAFRWDREGGLGYAVGMCNGNAACRKPNEGIMCPSFQAYGDERHSTRARAESLRAVMDGSMPADAFTSRGLYEILDLCLECKGCKTECPSQVDMAKMKSEFLYHYQEKHGYSLRSRLFANIDVLSRLGSAFAPFSNWGMAFPPAKWVLGALGLAPQRSLPPFTRKRFSRWFRTRKPPSPSPEINLRARAGVRGSRRQVVLFNDTYMEHNLPNLGPSAVKVLETLGYEVIVPPRSCCGRPAVSKGFLDMAKRKAVALVEILHPYAVQGLPILGLEPSCILTVKDDYPDLIPGEKADAVAARCQTLDEFLAVLARKGELHLPIAPSKKPILVHGHCYQKSLGTADCASEVLRAAGLQTDNIDSGCCGMAGSFGYEKEHYDFSLQVGETRLFPALRKAPEAAVAANGFSCRSQIKQGTGREARHFVEVLADFLTEPAPG